MSKQSRLILEQLEADLRNRPEDFVEGDYRLIDRKGNEYWIGNGFWFYSSYSPTKLPFSFLQKIKFNTIFNKWRAERLLSNARG